MTRDDWHKVLARLPERGIVELDDGPPVVSGLQTGTHNVSLEGEIVPPSICLLPLRQDDIARFGVRVIAKADAIGASAARLAAASIERGTEPVILSHVDRCGFEPLGFRVERITGATPGEIIIQEAEICRFWDLSIVIDLWDVARMR